MQNNLLRFFFKKKTYSKVYFMQKQTA